MAIDVIGALGARRARVQAEEELLVASAIDAVEENDAWVVLDDLHALERTSTDLLEAIARFARASRWIATTRVVKPVAGTLEQVRVLGPLSEGALHALAAQCAPAMAPAATDRFVRASAGSPWRLRQLLTGQDDATDERALARHVPESAAAFVEALSALRVPLPIDALARGVALPDAATLDALEQRGLLERSGLGLRLHDVARAHWTEETRGPRRAAIEAAWATALEGCDDPAASLEAVRLHLAGGDATRASTLLARRYDAIVDAGLAPSLARLLAPQPWPALDAVRLRSAVASGDSSPRTRDRPRSRSARTACRPAAATRRNAG